MTDDDKKTKQDPADKAPEASETTGTESPANAETGSQSTESGDQSPQGDPETPAAGDSAANNPEASGDTDGATDTTESGDADTFSREYVQELRQESAGYRTRVRDLEQQLHRLQVEQTGALADPADLPFDAAHLESPEALQAAIDALLADKPHLKARRFVGDVGQGSRGSAPAEVNLLGMLQGRV